MNFAEFIGAEGALLVRLDPLEVVRARGGRAGGIASVLAPGATADLALAEVAKRVREELASEGVRADVQVVADPMSVRPMARTQDLITGIVAGAAATVALLFLLRR